MLKYLILIVLSTLCLPSIIADIPEGMPEEVAAQQHNDCVAQTGVDEGIITIVNNKEGFPDDEKFKCYLKCILTFWGVIDDDGNVDVERFVGFMPDSIQPRAGRMIRACGTKQGAYPCDTVYITNKCYYDMDTEMYFIP